MIDPTTRERAVIKLLEDWPWHLGSILIGGYALAAYGAARYSDDVDFVIPPEARRPIEEWLAGSGFERTTETRQVFEATTRMKRGEETLDLLVGFVRDREAKVDVPEAWIALRPRRERLDLMTGSTGLKIPVARPEAIWALKLQAGRDQDLTDLFAILDTPVKSKEVLGMFEGLWVGTLGQKLSRVRAKLDDKKLYDDSRSRLRLKDSEEAKERWSRFRTRVEEMIPLRT